QHLSSVTQLGGLEGLLARMARGKRGMAGGMPVLRHVDVLELLRQLVDDGDHLLPAFYRERAAGDEAVLHVDDDEGGIAARLDRRGPGAKRSPGKAQRSDCRYEFEGFATLAIHDVLPCGSVEQNRGGQRWPSSPLISFVSSPPTRACTRPPVVMPSRYTISPGRGASATRTSMASKWLRT